MSLSSGSVSLPSDDEDEMMLSKLFKKEAYSEEIMSDQDKEVSHAKNQKALDPDMKESDHSEEVSRANKILKPKSSAKNQKADRTPGKKRKRVLLNEKEGVPLKFEF